MGKVSWLHFSWPTLYIYALQASDDDDDDDNDDEGQNFWAQGLGLTGGAMHLGMVRQTMASAEREPIT